MKDKILKVIAQNKEVRAYVARTTDLVSEAVCAHGLSKTAAAALGRTLTANIMLASDLKEPNHSSSIQIRTEGPIGNVITYVNGSLEAKGYVTNPKIERPIRGDGKIDVGGALTKNGTLTVVKDIGLKEPYAGTISLVSGEIAEDLTYYFAHSEQIPTAIALGVLVDRDSGGVLSAGGVMVQLLPEASDETINKIEKIMREGFSISALLAHDNYEKDILDMLFKDMDYHIAEEREPVFKCDCSKQRFLGGIISLGKKEIEALIKTNEDVETRCHFCNKVYIYTPKELI